MMLPWSSKPRTKRATDGTEAFPGAHLGRPRAPQGSPRFGGDLMPHGSHPGLREMRFMGQFIGQFIGQFMGQFMGARRCAGLYAGGSPLAPGQFCQGLKLADPRSYLNG